MPKPLADRFWAKVKRADGCWLWSGATTDGYGHIRSAGRGRALLAHRVMWEMAHGPIPNGLCVLHGCDVRRCVRPGHLFLGTKADNSWDAATKGRVAGTRLTALAVRAIRGLYATGGYSQQEIGLLYGVCQTEIGNVVRRKRWRHVYETDSAVG